MGDVLCTQHQHILMFLVMISALMVLIAQNITQPDEIKNIIKIAVQNIN